MATISELAERLARVETTVQLGLAHISERLDRLAEELSDQGRTPPPAPKSGGWSLPRIPPGSGREIAAILFGLAGLLGGFGGIAGQLLAEDPAPIERPAPTAVVTP